MGSAAQRRGVDMRKKEIEESEKRALIYCRVSTRQQKNDGSGLLSQEHRCREYAAKNNMVVEAVFPDDVSGGGDFMKRPGMLSLLYYLAAPAGHESVVIFAVLQRFDLDTEFPIKLSRAFQERYPNIGRSQFRH